ncbi:hypothetical protein E2C01_070969 [Portunus trituberculatus]|uniref:Uncharacterized protein n=1 Tax=Portunus trituberculatus TaxID=210409 RepID=A0A5B7I2S6_PORTR|nr:hypothetical protein [Portunus trituberculatus]
MGAWVGGGDTCDMHRPEDLAHQQFEGEIEITVLVMNEGGQGRGGKDAAGVVGMGCGFMEGKVSKVEKSYCLLQTVVEMAERDVAGVGDG